MKIKTKKPTSGRFFKKKKKELNVCAVLSQFHSVVESQGRNFSDEHNSTYY